MNVELVKILMILELRGGKFCRFLVNMCYNLFFFFVLIFILIFDFVLFDFFIIDCLNVYVIGLFMFLMLLFCCYEDLEVSIYNF